MKFHLVVRLHVTVVICVNNLEVLSGEVFSVTLRFDEKSVAVVRTSGGLVTVGQ